MILQACPECHRQYDVTHLEPGSKVRCACDHVLSVSVPRQLSVSFQKCKNCGGAIEPGHQACTYCGAELSPLDLAKSTLCPQCFTRLEDDAKHCKSCGVTIEPQALIPIPEGAYCPRCKWDLRIRSLARTSVVECTKCEGIWVRPETFETICNTAQNRPEISLTEKLVPVSAASPERRVAYIPCLICGELMLRKMFRYKEQPSYTIIDYCREHGVWLDRDELEQIVAFIRQRADVELPYDVKQALAGRKSTGPEPLIVGSIDPWTDRHGGLGGLFVLGALGGLLGAVLGDIFDR